MGNLSQPKSPLSTNMGTARPPTTPLTSGVVMPTQVNLLRGNANLNAAGSGIPKHVTNVSAAVSNASTGSTSVVAVMFRRDPSDKFFSGANVFVKGYQGNNNSVQVGAGADSPISITLNNTGENVSFTVQSYGNSGAASLNTAPSSSTTLPKSANGGYGQTTVPGYTVNNPPPASSASPAYMYGPGNFDFLTPNPSRSVTNDIANVVYFQTINSPYNLSFSKLSFTGFSGGTGYVNFAMYDMSGNLLISTGPITVPNFIEYNVDIALSPAWNFSPGSYMFAWTISDAGLTGMWGWPLSGSALDAGSSTRNLINRNGIVNFGFGTNTATSGAASMPATLGALNAVTNMTNIQIPAVLLQK